MTSAARAVLAAAAIGVLGAAAGCGGDEGTASSQRVGETRVGSVAPFAQCRDWRAAGPQERRATVEDIRSHVALEDTPTQIPALPDERAEEVFDNACADRFASGFRLYKLYARAAGFQSLR